MDENMNSQKDSKGALIGSIIVVILLIIGGIYMFKNTKVDYDDNTNTPDEVVVDLNDQGTSTDLDAISEDLNNTNLDNLVPDAGADATVQ